MGGGMTVRELMRKLSEYDPETEVFVPAVGLTKAAFDALVRSCGADAVSAAIPGIRLADGQLFPPRELFPVKILDFTPAVPPTIKSPFVVLLGTDAES